VVYGYGNFAIGLDPKFFHKLHIQSTSENLKLWTPISNPNPNRPLSCTRAKIFGSVYFAAWDKGSSYFAFNQTELFEVVVWQV